jgi:hypothetical protein
MVTMSPSARALRDGASPGPHEDAPAELLLLRDRIDGLPPPIREALGPILEDALDQARFRGRVLSIARDALVRLRLDLELARFDLDVTRQEREDLRRLIGSEA